MPYDTCLGERLDGRYELTHRLATTGMSRVYVAWDHRDQRFVVAKIAKPEHAERLKRATEALQAIQHPRVVRLLAAGDGYVVLERIEGMDLDRALRKRNDVGFPAREAVRMTAEALEGLACAHRAGFLHRDLKPENLMLGSGGVQLIDFDLVAYIDPVRRRARRLTRPGSFMGTPLYVSPEQCRDSSDVGIPSDVYAMGHVLYVLLTGVPAIPECSSTGGLLIRQTSMPPRPFSETAPRMRIPKTVQAVALCALEKRPADRYQSADEMRSALLDALP